MALEYLPLVAVLAVLGVVSLAPMSERVDRTLTRIALAVFEPYVRARAQFNAKQRRLLRAAHVGQTYRAYAAKTFLYATVAAVAGSILAVYFVAAGLVLVRGLSESQASNIPDRLVSLTSAFGPTVGLLELFGLLLASSATVGVVAALGTYQIRWSLLSYVAGERRRRIDASIQRNVAFIYALSRSGMAFTEVLRILTHNRDVYGETAEEFAVAVKDIDMYGFDFIEALRRLGDRTPSEDLEELAENLASVLRSGRQLSTFLHDQYEHFREESEAQQEQFLELLATIAEAYVTVFVAGPLFLITILVVIGLVMGGTLTFLRVFVYLLIPLATAGFVVYLDSITEDTHGGEETEPQQPEPDRFRDVRTIESTPAAATATETATGGMGESATAADGGTATAADRFERSQRERNEYRRAVYRRIQPIVRQLRRPFDVVVERPLTTLYLTIPIALLYLGFRWGAELTAGNFSLGAYDDPLIHATLVVTGTFAIAYEIRRRRLHAIEMAVPDFLDRMASTNEAGMPIVDSFGRVVQSDLGALTPELRRSWTDVQWGARLENALYRFQNRLATPTITRVVTLTTNAMNASGDLGPVLRIAADEAQASRRLERDRRNEMLTYLVVIYLAFFVFLVIVVSLDTIFIPNIPTGTLAESGGTGATAPTGIGGLQQVTEADKRAHRLLFFHTALVHAVCSGFVAGQMGEGDIKSGAKHATIMLGLAYLTFLIFA